MAGSEEQYDPKYIKDVEKYLKKCKDIYEKRETQERKGHKPSKLYRSEITVNLPTITGFARYIKRARKTIYNWRDNHPDFADALDAIMAEQEIRLVNQALGNKYNHAVANLMLSHNHGMVAKKDLTTGGKPIPLFDYTTTTDEEESE